MGMLSGIRRVTPRSIAMAVMIAGGLCGLHAQAEVSGPYQVISFNHIDRSVYSYPIDDFGAGGAYANESQGGSGIVPQWVARRIDAHVPDPR